LVGLLWTRDQLVAETSTCTKHNSDNRQTDINAPGWIRTQNSSKQAAADPCRRPREHRNQHRRITRQFIVPAAAAIQLPNEITNCCPTVNYEHGMEMSKKRALKGSV